MEERPLDFLKKICYNKRKNLFYRSGTLEKPIKHMRIPDRPCGGTFGNFLGHMRVARSRRNFAYGVYRSENRVLTSV